MQRNNINMVNKNLSTLKIGDFVSNSNFIFNTFSVIVDSWSVMFIKCYRLNKHF